VDGSRFDITSAKQIDQRVQEFSMLLGEWTPDADEDILLCHELKAFLGIRRLKANGAPYIVPITEVRSSRATTATTATSCHRAAGAKRLSSAMIVVSRRAVWPASTAVAQRRLTRPPTSARCRATRHRSASSRIRRQRQPLSGRDRTSRRNAAHVSP